MEPSISRLQKLDVDSHEPENGTTLTNIDIEKVNNMEDY